MADSHACTHTECSILSADIALTQWFQFGMPWRSVFRIVTRRKPYSERSDGGTAGFDHLAPALAHKPVNLGLRIILPSSDKLWTADDWVNLRESWVAEWDKIYRVNQ